MFNGPDTTVLTIMSELGYETNLTVKVKLQNIMAEYYLKNNERLSAAIVGAGHLLFTLAIVKEYVNNAIGCTSFKNSDKRAFLTSLLENVAELVSTKEPHIKVRVLVDES